MPKRPLPSIIIVEDSPEDVLLLQQRLAAAGIKHPVSVFADSRPAIEYLTRTCLEPGAETALRPCLLLIDLKMPAMSGFELAKWVRAQPALDRVTIALLTDSDEPTDIESGYRAGADRYLVKHPSPEVLAELIATAVLRWRARSNS